MPPRTRYTRERILDASLALTREHGVDTLSARTVAGQLGSSTAPVFTHFANMDELLEALTDRIMRLFVKCASEPRHADPVLSAGIGWLRFALDEPRLYEAIFLRQHPWHPAWGTFRKDFAKRLEAHADYAHLDLASRFALIGRASIVLHGVGLELWSGRLPHDDLHALIDALVRPVITAALEHGSITDLHSLPATPASESA